MSAERRLEKLVNLYVYSYPNRLYRTDSKCVLLTDSAGNSFNWKEVANNLDKPGIRPLIVFDLDMGSRFIPMFTELDTGKGVKLYEQFIGTVPDGETVPSYPTVDSADYDVRAKIYWEALWKVFDSRIAMETVENATENEARIAWIDYRIIGFDAGVAVPIHLHISPRGQFATGTFAYQLIRRGQKHGIRLLGSLKKGEDVNVLAIYER